MPDPHPRKHSLVVQLAEELHDAMKGSGTEEVDVWKALLLAQSYNITSFVEHEFYTNWSNRSNGSLKQWILDDFSGKEERFTEFLRRAEHVNSYSAAAKDGIEPNTSYTEAMPVKHIKDEQKMLLPGGNEEIIILQWELTPWIAVDDQDRRNDPSLEGKNWRPHDNVKSRNFRAIDHRTRWRYDVTDPVSKSSYHEQITTKTLYNILPQVKLGREKRGDDWWIMTFRKAPNCSYNGKPIYASLEGKWTIQWSKLPSVKMTVKNSKGKKSTVKLPSLEGWVLVDRHYSAAIQDGKQQVEDTSGDHLLQQTRLGEYNYRWRSLEGTSEPTGMAMYDRRLLNGTIKLPGNAKKSVWTVEDTKLQFGSGKSFTSHVTAFNAAHKAWAMIRNNKPKSLLSLITEIYSKCKQYPDIIERFHSCFYYFNPFLKYVSYLDDSPNEIFPNFRSGDEYKVSKINGAFSTSDVYFNQSRMTLRESIAFRIKTSEKSKNYDARSWSACMYATAYCGEITWEEKDSNGKVFEIGPFKVWGHPMNTSGSWEVKTPQGLKVSGNTPDQSVYSEYSSDVNPFEANGYDLIKSARVPFGYGWKCEKRPILPPLPPPEPIDIQPSEPDPPWLNAQSVPAYDNVTMGWLDGAYLMTSMITDLKGVESPFNNFGSSAAMDTGQGVRQLNESSRAAKTSSNPSNNLAKSHVDSANGNTMSGESSPAPASDGGGSMPDFDNKSDEMLNSIQNKLGKSNLTDLASLLAELAKRHPHLQKLIMSALEALMNGSAGMLLSVCKQILGLNIDDPAIAQIKELCNSNVTDFYTTADLPGNAPSTVGNIKKGIAAMAEAQLADNEFIGDMNQVDCIIDE